MLVYVVNLCVWISSSYLYSSLSSSSNMWFLDAVEAEVKPVLILSGFCRRSSSDVWHHLLKRPGDPGLFWSGGVCLQEGSGCYQDGQESEGIGGMLPLRVMSCLLSGHYTHFLLLLLLQAEGNQSAQGDVLHILFSLRNHTFHYTCRDLQPSCSLDKLTFIHQRRHGLMKP